jgi:hypothetical protein
MPKLHNQVIGSKTLCIYLNILVKVKKSKLLMPISVNKKFIIIFIEIKGLFIQFNCEMLSEPLIKIPMLFMMGAKKIIF